MHRSFVIILLGFVVETAAMEQEVNHIVNTLVYGGNLIDSWVNKLTGKLFDQMLDQNLQIWPLRHNIDILNTKSALVKVTCEKILPKCHSLLRARPGILCNPTSGRTTALSDQNRRHIRMYRHVEAYAQAQDPRPDMAQSDNIEFWTNLGFEGGGEVSGYTYSEKECFQKALACNPQSAVAWSNLGAFGGCEKYSEKECYEKALSLNPEDAPTWFNLGQVGGGIINGQKHSENDCFMKALSLDPDARNWCCDGRLDDLWNDMYGNNDPAQR